MTIYNSNLTAVATDLGPVAEDPNPYSSLNEQSNKMRETAKRKCVRVKRMRAVSDAYKEATCETLISDTEVAIKVLERITQKAQEEKYRAQLSGTQIRTYPASQLWSERIISDFYNNIKLGAI